ncbi:Rieske 2Fe-2S domain-containing protein [Carboxylicivirga taeanensis]|uniref:Rieske 2Fe-2S domain-containing protein n=1 Tax=Carboxylicivirga taeanensis TaxID=1416875 RepID=UPI003F6DDC65
MKKLLFLAIIMSAIGCNKDSAYIIPNVRFTAEIDLDNPQYKGSFTFKVLPSARNPRIGVNGVVVCALTSEEHYAFDLLCTHQHEKTGFFYVDFKPGDVNVACPECGSEFNVAAEYGSVVKGPAKWPLKRYQTSVTGNFLRIWN